MDTFDFGKHNGKHNTIETNIGTQPMLQHRSVLISLKPQHRAIETLLTQLSSIYKSDNQTSLS